MRHTARLLLLPTTALAALLALNTGNGGTAAAVSPEPADVDVDRVYVDLVH